MNPLQRAIFLDRDGTLIHDVGYLSNPDGVVLLPGVAEALRTLSESNFLLIVVSNQSGIGRGLISWNCHRAVHRKFIELFAREGVLFDDIRYCPHSPAAQCCCRKPLPTTLEHCAHVWGIDLTASFMVGDKASDLLAGLRAGCQTILVARDPNGDPPMLDVHPDLAVRGLSDAVKYILGNNR